MNENITMQQFSDLLEKSNKPIFEKLGALEYKIDEASRNINDSLITSAVLETKIQNLDNNNNDKHEKLEQDLNSNWVVTRKLESRITKWSGIAVGLSIASGFIIKLAF